MKPAGAQESLAHAHALMGTGVFLCLHAAGATKKGLDVVSELLLGDDSDAGELVQEGGELTLPEPTQADIDAQLEADERELRPHQKPKSGDKS